MERGGPGGKHGEVQRCFADLLVIKYYQMGWITRFNFGICLVDLGEGTVLWIDSSKIWNLNEFDHENMGATALNYI